MHIILRSQSQLLELSQKSCCRQRANIFCVSTNRRAPISYTYGNFYTYTLYRNRTYTHVFLFMWCGVIHQFLYTLDWPHKGWGSHVHNIWAYSQQQCEHSWLSQKSLWPTRTHTDKATATHTYTYTPEEINDCDLLHLIAHKPGPSTCSNNFWLSHLSRFASMRGWAASSSEIAGDERANEHLRFTVPPINLRPPLSLTKRNVHFIKTNFNRPTRGCQTATTAGAVAALSTFHFIFDLFDLKQTNSSQAKCYKLT